MEQQEEQPLLLSVPQTARLLNVCERSVWTMIEDGQLKRVRVGKRVLIPRTVIEQFVESAS